jgi:hypothetical protein
MKSGKSSVGFPILVALICGGIAHEAPAQTVPALGQAWHYTLLPGSQMVDAHPVGGRPDIVVPLQGTFSLRLVQEGPLFSTYAWESIAWAAGTPGGPSYQVNGRGDFSLGGEVALVQTLFLEVHIDDGRTNRLCYFTNAPGPVDRWWPMIHLSADQTNGTLVQQFQLEIFAAPFQEIWFSTAHGLTAGIWQPPTNAVSGGDLISSAGRVVKRNQALTARLGIMPGVPDLGLDAVDILPGGEIAFSIEQDAFSETLGPLHNGDVLSDRGRIVTNYAALIGAFGPEPPPADEGLDALQVMPGGEICFSVTNDFFSERLGRRVRRGDLLSSSGRILKTNEELVARFRPADPKKDYGLDALYVWPSGEIWFSVETGFYGQHFESYLPGDLLSDQGYVVYRNLDLVGAFQPLEDLADFGLDALFIVTDVAAPPAAAGSLRCAAPLLDQKTGNVTLNWKGSGHVYQVEKATNILGPWQPISPILTEPPVIDVGAITKTTNGFYRVREW